MNTSCRQPRTCPLPVVNPSARPERRLGAGFAVTTGPVARYGRHVAALLPLLTLLCAGAARAGEAATASPLKEYVATATPSSVADAGRRAREHIRDDLADQFVVERSPAVPLETACDRGINLAPNGLAIRPRGRRNRTQTLAGLPPSKDLPNHDHRRLPKRHDEPQLEGLRRRTPGMRRPPVVRSSWREGRSGGPHRVAGDKDGKDGTNAMTLWRCRPRDRGGARACEPRTSALSRRVGAGRPGRWS